MRSSRGVVKVEVLCEKGVEAKVIGHHLQVFSNILTVLKLFIIRPMFLIRSCTVVWSIRSFYLDDPRSTK